MYFWRISELKTKLQERPLTDREAFPYLLAYVLLTTSVTLFPADSMNTWDYVIAIAVIVLTLGGTVYAYRCNGGANGEHFLQRYLAIGWVVAVRWAATIFPLFIILMIVFGALDGATWQVAVYFAIAGAVFYQRLCHHIRQVATSTLRSNPTVETDAHDAARGSP